MSDPRSDAPRVAVVIPAYNAEEFLFEALDSVLAQTYESWEAIIVDDASTDRTREIAAGYAERHPGRFIVIGLDENGGVSEARNRAIAASRGAELITLLDADDYWLENYLETTVGLYDEGRASGRRIGIVACNAFIHGRDGLTEQTWADTFWWTDRIDYDHMIDRNYILARAVFSREAYDEVGAFSTECYVRDDAGSRYAASDDYDLWLRIMEAGYEVTSTREPITVYRYAANGVSRDPGVVADAVMVAYQRALERGKMTRRQRRMVRHRVRHHLALRLRSQVYDALEDRRPAAIVRGALLAAPAGAVAFVQAPSRWREWVGDLVNWSRLSTAGLRGTWAKIGYTAGARAYSLLTAFLILILTARVLGPPGRGTLAAVTTWVTLVSTVAYLSLGQVALFHATKADRREWLGATLGTLLWVAGIMSVLGWMVIVGIYVVSGGRAFTNLSAIQLLLGFMVLPFMIWEQYGSSLLAAIDRLDIYNRAQLVGRSVGLALVVLALYTHLGILGVLGALVVMRGIVAAAGIGLLMREARAPVRADRGTLRRLLVGGAKLHVHAIGAFLFTATDVLVVNYFRGPTETGLYQLAVQLVTAMLVAPVAANLVLFGKTTALGADGAWPATRKVLVQLTGAMGVFAIVAGLTAPWVLPALVGADFSRSVGVFQLLLCALVAMTFTNVMATQWIARGLFWQISVLYFAIGIFNLGLNLVLVPVHGMQGSAWALLATYAIALVVNGWLALKCERRYRRGEQANPVAQPSLG